MVVCGRVYGCGGGYTVTVVLRLYAYIFIIFTAGPRRMSQIKRTVCLESYLIYFIKMPRLLPLRIALLAAIAIAQEPYVGTDDAGNLLYAHCPFPRLLRFSSTVAAGKRRHAGLVPRFKLQKS